MIVKEEIIEKWVSIGTNTYITKASVESNIFIKQETYDQYGNIIDISSCLEQKSNLSSIRKRLKALGFSRA